MFFLVFGSVLLLLLESQVIIYGKVDFLQSAKVAPFMAEMVMIIGGVLLILKSLVFKKEEYVDINWDEQKYAAATILAFCIFAAAIYFAGFLIGSIVFIGLMFRLYKNKNILEFIGLCVLAVGIFFLFTMVFHVQLPGIGGIR